MAPDDYMNPFKGGCFEGHDVDACVYGVLCIAKKKCGVLTLIECVSVHYVQIL